MLVGAVVLGAALLLGWVAFGLTRSPAARAEDGGRSGPEVERQAAAITYREPAVSGGPIALSLAVHNARLFSGQPGLKLDGDQEQGQFGGSAYAFYYLETLDGDQSYKVDARSGEVLEMTRLDVLAGRAGAHLDAGRAESIAAHFAAGRFHDFRAMSLAERTVTPAAGGNQMYGFKWVRVAPESGAELPTTVTVSVSAANGAVAWYLAQRDATTLDVQPTVSREAAIMSAALLADRAERWDARAPSSSRLQVVYDLDNQQQFVWAITFPSKAGETPLGRPNLRILIDARSGEPISSPS